ncbi:MAG: hypothetical protein K6360_04470 [Deltaproteobacteria bacterium]
MIRRHLLSAIVSFLLIGSPSARAEFSGDIRANFFNGDLSSFYHSIWDYYRVPERDIYIIRDCGLAPWEVPVVCHIARAARCSPMTIIDLRHRGLSWYDITLHFGLSPDIYYVPLPRGYMPCPQYGKAYGHYKKKRGRVVILDDDDIVNLVNLRFMSDYHHVPPERIIDLRSRHRDFIVIDRDFREKTSCPGHGSLGWARRKRRGS